MKVQRIVASLAVLLLSAVASPTVKALDVTLFQVTTDSTGTETETPLTPALSSNGTSTVNLDSDAPVGGPKTYFNGTSPVFSIQKCSGCTGRARIFVSEGSIDKLVFTDAQIINRAGQVAKLRIRVGSGLLSVSGVAGYYPYAVELNGSFVGSLPTDPNNQIQVTATATANANCGECEGGGTSLIDSPALDPGEDPAVFPYSAKYSVVAPPFSAGGVAVFSPKEQQNLLCNGWAVVTSDVTVDSCLPSLGLKIDVQLQAAQSARIPGSIGAFHVASICEPDSLDPKLQKGCDIMANFFASLGPKGFKVYDVRLEPTPGGQTTVYARGIPSSDIAWTTKRGAPDDDDNSSVDGNISNTRVRLQSNGVGDVKANGLCPATGCTASNALPVQLFCTGQTDPMFETLLQLNSKGDGKADLIFSLPCNDPAVLILDGSGRWVAAPAIL